MDVVLFNPFFLRVTDPLLKLQESRYGIADALEAGKIDPIYAFDDKSGFYLIFNGNKRTVIGRELLKRIPGCIIQNDADLWLAQEKQPRNLPRDVEFTYNGVMDHLSKRANQMARYDAVFSPIRVEDGMLRVGPSILRLL
jgi:hypothetical protein